MDIIIPQSVLSDLSYLSRLNPPLIHFTISEVCRQITNKNQGRLDMLKVQREFENEDIELSLDKIQRIIFALKNFLHKILKSASSAEIDQATLLQKVQTILIDRTSLKQVQIQTFIQALQQELQLLDQYKEKNQLKTFFDQIKLKQLHDISTNECKNLKRTYAILVFMISDVDGQVKTRTLEVSLDELQKFKEEIVRIEESLS